MMADTPNLRVARRSHLLLTIPLVLLAAPSAASAGAVSVIHTFGGPPDGAYPSGLVADESGNLFGQTEGGGDECSEPQGGKIGCGLVYKINPAGQLTTLEVFTGANGLVASSRLTLKGDRLYGSTMEGGSDDLGVLYSIKTDGSHFKLLHQFVRSGGDPSTDEGVNPTGTLAVDDNGVVYGTTASGGAYKYSAGGGGVLFEIMPDGMYIVLHNFSGGSDGADPTGVIIRAGKLFGATYGIENGGETVYQYGLASGKLTTFYIFSAGSTNNNPEIAGADSQGNLFGFTQGSLTPHQGSGTLFEFAKQGHTYGFSTLYSFDESAGGAEPAGLSVAADGALIGFTKVGPVKPPGTGTLFSYSGGTLTTLYTFGAESANGFYPQGAPAVLPSGSIYGTTSQGGNENCDLARGAPGCGVVFEYTP